MRNVTVIDSIMGSGKTSWAIQYMNESPANIRFIYITPYLDEVARIRSSVISRQFFEPDNNNSEGKKPRSFKSLIASGKDIPSTHALFRTVDEEVIELLTGSGYTLILDEVMCVIERAPIGSQDIRAAIQSFAKVEDNRVIWTDEEYVDNRFQDIKLLAKAGNLFYHRNQFLIWTLPPQVFKAFDNVIVMTYLSDAQIQRYYYDMHSISYKYQAIKAVDGRYQLSAYDRNEEGRGQLWS
jgi:hypothetical protein